MFDAIKVNVRSGIEVVEMDNNINDPEFSAKAVEIMLALIKQSKAYTKRPLMRTFFPCSNPDGHTGLYSQEPGRNSFLLTDILKSFA
jgi:hypothetical protein